MTPEDFVDRLEDLGTVDTEIVRKLRKQVSNPEKRVTSKKILSFLLKKNHVSRAQAVELKKMMEAPAPAEEELGLAEEVLVDTFAEEQEAAAPQPVAPNVDQTDELVQGVRSSSAILAPEIAEAELDELQEVAELEGGEAPTVMGDLLAPDESMADKTVAMDPEFANPAADDGFGDPMATSWDAVEGGGAAAKKVGFQGKIDASDQWATKWVYIGFATLGLLLVVGGLLYFVLAFITAEDRFEAANKSFQNGTYGDSIKRFNEFLEKHPSHKNAPAAKVTLVEATLLESYRQDNWGETIVRANRVLVDLVDDESIEWDGLRQNLAVWLPNSTLEIAKRAAKQESRTELVAQLEKAKSAKQLVDNKVYIPNSFRKKELTSKTLLAIDEEIAKCEVLIDKQKQFDATLTQIAALRETGETDEAHTAYNKLIRAYGDLRANEQLQEEMRKVSQLEAQLVKPIESSIAPVNAWRPNPIESTTLLASKTGEAIPSLAGEVIPVLADGAAYGIDLGDGSVKWRRFVGYQTTIQPKVVNSDYILIADQLNNDLVLVSANTGSLVWRCEIAEPFLDPQVDEEMILVTAESGNLFRIQPDSGEIKASSHIPQNANVPMMRSPRQGLIYQVGFYSNIYILSEDDLSCRDVHYLGHYRGSVSVPPVVWNNFVLVAVNDSGICDLRVLKQNTETDSLELAQNVVRVTRGIVTNPLVRFGRFMLINSESGDLKILEMNTAEETNPLRTLAEEKFENRDATKTYLATAGSQLWVGSQGLIRYKVSRSQGTFARQQLANSNDYFVGPIRKFGSSIVHIRKRDGSALTSVSAVDEESLKQIWRTDLGGPLAGPPIVADNRLIAVSSQGDLFSSEIPTGPDQGVTTVATEVAKASNIVEDLLFENGIQLTDSSWAYIGQPGTDQLLHVDVASGKSKLVRLAAPANESAAAPIRLGEDLIFATKTGQVVRVNPKTGRTIGTPFLPPVTPGVEQPWKRPVLVSDSQFVVAAEDTLFLIDVSAGGLLKKVAEVSIEATIESELAMNGNQVFCVVNAKEVQKLTSFQVDSASITAGTSLPLETRSLDGPWAVGQYVMLRQADGKLVCFDSQLGAKWTADVGSSTLATAPRADGNTVRLYFSSGKSIALGLESGQLESEFEIGQPIVHDPTFANGKAIVAGLDGTLHTVTAE